MFHCGELIENFHMTDEAVKDYHTHINQSINKTLSVGIANPSSAIQRLAETIIRSKKGGELQNIKWG